MIIIPSSNLLFKTPKKKETAVMCSARHYSMETCLQFQHEISSLCAKGAVHYRPCCRYSDPQVILCLSGTTRGTQHPRAARGDTFHTPDYRHVFSSHPVPARAAPHTRPSTRRWAPLSCFAPCQSATWLQRCETRAPANRQRCAVHLSLSCPRAAGRRAAAPLAHPARVQRELGG